MSDATERPADRTDRFDTDAWETACAEDLAAEKARRRAQYGPPPGSAAEELRRLAEAVTDKLAGIQLPGALAGMAAQGAVQQLFRQAKAVVEPVVERNPEVFDHLAAAGSELLAAYRSAVQNSESRWTREAADEAAAADPRDAADPQTGRDGGNVRDLRDRRDTPDGARRDDDGPAGTERIDLD
ncbi:hypothetical protein ADK70_32715 [Streptomyces rimosus subsp. pseudoverticillatus]|uniref:DUF5304 domain-containing protein n=1 Tax=Streptomyces rimosus TaxID=1927 RepID=UPI0006B296DC|nr:DUF5304 domain-containing protein [Streptomyces rimosus]KOT78791.1 hypothetical protein ADK70_32715 [Streptomyces rimosus subsp. pseudoverticillatus]